MESSLEGALRQLTPYPTEVCLMEYPFIAALTLKTSRISVGYQTSLYLLFISKTPYCIYRLTKVPQSKGPFSLGKIPLSQHLPAPYLPTIHTVERGFNLAPISGSTQYPHPRPHSFQFNTGRTYSRRFRPLPYLHYVLLYHINEALSTVIIENYLLYFLTKSA